MLLPRENAIHNSNCRFLCGDVGAGLSHDGDQCDLLYVGALPAHVRPSDDHCSLRVPLQSPRAVSPLCQRGPYAVFPIGSVKLQ